MQAATDVIDSGWYIQGAQVQAFEREFANYCGTKYCIGVANGLDALILTLRAWKELGKLKDGDEVCVLIMGEGVTSRDKHRDRNVWESEFSDLSKAAHEANNILGTTSLTLGVLPEVASSMKISLLLPDIIVSLHEVFSPSVDALSEDACALINLILSQFL